MREIIIEKLLDLLESRIGNEFSSLPAEVGISICANDDYPCVTVLIKTEKSRGSAKLYYSKKSDRVNVKGFTFRGINSEGSEFLDICKKVNDLYTGCLNDSAE